MENKVGFKDNGKLKIINYCRHSSGNYSSGSSDQKSAGNILIQFWHIPDRTTITT